jgi:hypothetical protein
MNEAAIGLQIPQYRHWVVWQQLVNRKNVCTLGAIDLKNFDRSIRAGASLVLIKRRALHAAKT